MTDYSIWTAESLTQQTFTNTSYAEKATLDFTAPAQGDYLIFVQWMYCSTDATLSIVTRVQLDDTTTLHEGFAEPQVAGPTNSYRSGGMFYLAEDLASGDHYIDLDAYVESAATGYLKNVRIVVIRLDNVLTTSGMYGYAASEGSTTITAAVGSAQTLTTLNITPDTTGDYLILGYSEIDANSTSYSAYVTLNVTGSEDLPVDSGYNTTSYAFMGFEAKDATDWIPVVCGGIVSLTSGASRSIILEGYRSNSSTTSACRKNRVIAIRVAALSTLVQSNEVTTETSGTNTSYSSSTYRAQLSWSPSGTEYWVILGGMTFFSTSTSYSAYGRIEQTAGTSTETVNEGIERPKQVGTGTTQQDSYPLFGVVYKSLAASTTQTFQTQYRTVTSGTVYVRNAYLIAFPRSDTIVTTSSTTKNSDARIKQVGVQTTKSSNATIKQLGVQTTLYSDALIVHTESIQLSSDARIKQLGVYDTFTSDARIIKTSETTETSDARIKHVEQITQYSDSRILRIASQLMYSDSRIKTTAYEEFLSNARIKQVSSSLMYSDAIIKRTEDVDYYSDSRILRQENITKSSDSRIKKTSYEEFLSDAYIQGEQPQLLMYSNACIKSTEELQIYSDARIKTTDEIQLYSDARIKTTSSSFINSDTRIKVISQINKTSDTNIKSTNEYSLNSIARIIRTEQILTYSNAKVVDRPPINYVESEITLQEDPIIQLVKIERMYTLIANKTKEEIEGVIKIR